MTTPKDDLLNSPITKSESLVEKYFRVRRQTENICKPLHPEDYVAQPVIDVSPPKWHLAHTTWFFEQFVLIPEMEGYQWYDEDFAFMFNSYYNTVGDRVLRPDRGNMTRPGTDEVLKYRAHVDLKMEEFFEGPIKYEIWQVIELGLNHEQQHQELLVTDLKYILGHNPLFPVYNENLVEKIKGANNLEGYYEVEEGVYEIGYPGEEFHFDNEKSVHKVFINSFKARKDLVTNGEYIEFIEAGGYSDFRFWLSEGWDWVNTNSVMAPLYWHKVEGEWHNYTLSGFKKVNPDDPVTHISMFEAEAFAQWKNIRLLTEFEWEVLANKYGKVTDKSIFVESESLQPIQNNTNNLLGNAWEWTYSSYLPYPGFDKQEGALGEYNGKFMINQMVLRGGSCATPKDHIRNTYRNFFHPHLRWQFTGIRLAEL